jgi:MFS family permease
VGVHAASSRRRAGTRGRHRAQRGLGRDFWLLLSAATASHIGTQVRLVALPLVAVFMFQASAFETGLLQATGTLAILLIGLPAGAWVDRMRRRPVLIATDVARGVLLLSIPAAVLFGVLTMVQLYVVSFLVGLATVLFDVAHFSYLPSVVHRQRLARGVSRLEAVEYGAIACGPGFGGALVQILTAPFTLLVDAISFLVSAALLTGIQARETKPVRVTGANLWRDIREGLGLVQRNPVLRAIAVSGATIVGFHSAWTGVQTIFLIRDLGLSPGAYGVVLGIAAGGGLVGAFVAAALARRWGVARAMWASLLVTSPFMLLMPLAEEQTIALYAVGATIGGFGLSVFNVTQITLRQTLCPEHLLGRMNATMRFLMWSVIPLGGFLGGVVAEVAGTSTTLWVCVFGQLLAAVPLLAGTVRSIRDMPEPANEVRDPLAA